MAGAAAVLAVAALSIAWSSADVEDHALLRRLQDPEREPELDPRFWKTVDRWRDQERKRRRLMHNAAQGESAPRHSSVHWFYHPSDGATSDIAAWYNEVMVTSRDEDSFFNVNGHAFGYFGIQSVDMSGTGASRAMSSGKVIFSIWDELCKGDDMNACPEDKRVQITQCGDDCTCERFGGEGTGAKSGWYYNTWKMNTPYSFMTLAEAQPGNQVRYTGYFYAPDFGWKVLGAFIVNRGSKDWGIHGQYSFVEQWTHKNPEATRWAKFGPIFARRGFSSTDLWDPVYQAKWYHGTATKEDQTHINSNASATHWEMGIGGSIIKEATINEIVRISPGTSCPNPLVFYVGNESEELLPTAQPPVIIPRINCGGEYVEYSCENCTKGNGGGWCNGECAWTSTPGQTNSWGEQGLCQTQSRRLSEDAPAPELHRRLNAPPQAEPIICHGGGTGTTTPHAKGYLSTEKRVVTVFLSVASVNYATLSADAALAASVRAAAVDAVADQAGTEVTASLVSVTMSSGSLILKAKVTPPPSRNYTAVQLTLQTASSATLPTKVKEKINAVSGISAVTTGTISVSTVNVSSEVVSVNILTDSKEFFFLARTRPVASLGLAFILCTAILELSWRPLS